MPCWDGFRGIARFGESIMKYTYEATAQWKRSYGSSSFGNSLEIFAALLRSDIPGFAQTSAVRYMLTYYLFKSQKNIFDTIIQGHVKKFQRLS